MSWSGMAKHMSEFPDDFQIFSDSLFVDLPRVRLDGGARAFRRRWGYEGGLAGQDPLQPPPLIEEEEDSIDGPEEDDGGIRQDSISLTETSSANIIVAGNLANNNFDCGSTPASPTVSQKQYYRVFGPIVCRWGQTKRSPGLVMA
ncbi:hypothetical protein AAG570_009043 [Ranatra chinensis]|uniref:Uncharacterized protein n=1 Tax=Ranatra chinensis TaxID=642074 RepID=A0ABD0Z5H4_9HEMI